MYGAPSHQAQLGPRRSLRADVLLMLPAKLGLLLCGVVTSALIARALGPTGRGAVAVAASLTLILVQLGTVGLATANPYFVAREASARLRIVANSVWFAFAAGTLMVLIGVAVRAVVPDALQGLGGTELALALAGIPAALLVQFLQGILLGEGRTIAYNAGELSIAVLTLVSIAVAVATTGLSVAGALGILLAGRIVAGIVFLGVVARWRRPIFALPDLSLAGRMLGYALRVYAATLLAFLVIRIDMLLVNGYLGPEQAGLYSVAVALADTIYLLPAVIALNLFTRVAHGLEADTSAQVFRSVVILYGLLCGLSIILAGPIISVVFGPEFDAASPLYRWLAPGIFALGLLNVIAHYFAGTGFPIEAALVWVVGLAINIAVNLVFLADEGTYIAPLASSIAYVVLLALHIRMFAPRAGGYRAMIPRPQDAAALLRAARRGA